MAYEPRLRGEFAVKDGVEIPCSYQFGQRTVLLFSYAAENPDPELYSWNEESGRWVGKVDADKFDTIVSVHALATYLGHRCYVDSLDGGVAELVYDDQTGDWPVQHGFEQHDRGTFRRKVNVAELYDFREEHRDLVFAEWRERTFGKSAAS